MVRKRQSDKGEQVSIIDLAPSIGFSPIGNSEHTSVKDMLPTFIPQWDYIMGGGIPFGRMTEIYAENQVGKSTLMIYLNRVANSLGADTFWLDAEGTSEGGRMEELGVDSNHTFIFAPKSKDEKLTVEQIGRTTEDIINTYRDNDSLKNVPLLVIWDSIGGTITEAEDSTEFGEEGQRGRSAAAVTKFVKKITPQLKDVNIALVCINQVRTNQDRMNKYAPRFIAGGGEALKHADSLRLELTKSSQIKAKPYGEPAETYVGHAINMKIDKSKQSRPHQAAKAALISDWLLDEDTLLDGIDYEYNLYSYGKESKLITTSGAYRNYTTLAGEQIRCYEVDFLHRMKQDVELTKDLFIQETIALYKITNGYPRYLDNENLNVDNWPGITELRDYFKKVNATNDNRRFNSSLFGSQLKSEVQDNTDTDTEAE